MTFRCCAARSHGAALGRRVGRNTRARAAPRGWSGPEGRIQSAPRSATPVVSTAADARLGRPRLRRLGVRRRGQEGFTPLHSAARYGGAPVVEELLRRGADKAAKDTVRPAVSPPSPAAPLTSLAPRRTERRRSRWPRMTRAARFRRRRRVGRSARQSAPGGLLPRPRPLPQTLLRWPHPGTLPRRAPAARPRLSCRATSRPPPRLARAT